MGNQYLRLFATLLTRLAFVKYVLCKDRDKKHEVLLTGFFGPNDLSRLASDEARERYLRAVWTEQLKLTEEEKSRLNPRSRTNYEILESILS